MEASSLIKFIETFELKASGCSTVTSAMVAAFGVYYDNYPEYLEVENYVRNCMSYDKATGEWY